jgi:hypothetical protein
MRVVGILVKWAGALFLISLLVLTGCATVEGIWCAEGFSSQDMREDGLVVGSVVDAVDETDPQSERLWGTFLREELEDGDDAIPARDPEELYQALGSEQYDALMDEYRSTGALSPESLHGIADSGVDDRYMVLVRVLRSDVEESEDSESEGDDVTYTKKSNRTVEVVAQVFDLEAGAVVWRAAGSNEMERETTYDKADWVERALSELIGMEPESEPDYPEAPTTRDVLTRLHERLASELKEA